MSNVPNHKESEQEVLNEARNSTYGAVDTIVQVETTAGSATAPLSGAVRGSKNVASVEIVDASGNQITTFGSSQVDAHPVQSDGTTLVLTSGGQTGEKVMEVGRIPLDSATDSVTVSGTATVTATDLDIRNLTATDVVTANLSATDNAVLDDIALKVTDNLDGTPTHGTRDLTSANTWYAVPSTVPTAAYILIAQPRTGNAGTVRWSFLNSGTPGAGTGLEIQGNLVLRLAANESVVFASTTAGDDVDWTCKEIA